MGSRLYFVSMDRWYSNCTVAQLWVLDICVSVCLLVFTLVIYKIFISEYKVKAKLKCMML